MSNRNAHVLIGGYFNCVYIEWSKMQVSQGLQRYYTQQQLLDFIIKDTQNATFVLERKRIKNMINVAGHTYIL